MGQTWKDAMHEAFRALRMLKPSEPRVATDDKCHATRIARRPEPSEVGCQSTMKSRAPDGLDERWGSAPSATW
jgi:hypothetical protein